MNHLPNNLMLIFKYFFFLILLIGCTTQNPLSDQKNNSTIEVEGIGEINEIIFTSAGPPVNPKYSKTFTIHISLDSMKLTLDSLKTMTFDMDRSISKAEVDFLCNRFKEYKLKKIPDDQLGTGDGCLGGRGEELTLKMNEEILLNGFNYRCAGNSFGNLSGDVSGLLLDLEKIAYQQLQ